MLIKYSNNANVFFSNLVIKLPENRNMNKYAIELMNNKLPSYQPIFALSLVKLETLRSYIKIH